MLLHRVVIHKDGCLFVLCEAMFKESQKTLPTHYYGCCDGGEKGGKEEGGSTSVSDLIMKVSQRQCHATLEAVSEDALPAAKFFSRPWNCIFPFHSDTCWEELSRDSPTALFGGGLRSAK